ncbi:hypothetical protein MJO28_005807 [Puccinia striiformis f. sp. tritici]|uniref:Secreted protein n=4 Tax=Puccinia striiformis TaxID=27350 RepID=A0A0L0UYP3_9BASI|nr:hypothetical protein Pst134EA_033383 [Puccinia striiformis f. sp. tritici]XP_047808854.1 hypothetical protein Pst134EA_033385 [Puccinia striiformis f. sp. tritici]KAI9628290.1 hypothetical protein H4Q26_018129 [Puccinia striiformis f. sp. tritici PST-130]KNE92177.1 hypothetical protein PSTG_14413 [Puccinia striiformis f. sp. tritici PST-78]POW08671.1 hypothetical protein PSTT_07330 [Puccinia striiformis]KAH9469398.1 hypothetical protein Pst134EA_033383 [Puccinia striiformis f. sp. tritici]
MHISNLMKAFIVISIHTQVTCAKVFNCPALAGDPGNNIGWCWREILAKDRANELETIRLDGRDFFGKRATVGTPGVFSCDNFKLGPKNPQAPTKKLCCGLTQPGGIEFTFRGKDIKLCDEVKV